jgi:hypothetical protein
VTSVDVPYLGKRIHKEESERHMVKVDSETPSIADT